jgi:hypothetical protein
MQTTTAPRAPTRRPMRRLRVILLAAGLSFLGGCSYLDAQRARPPTPDPRIRIGYRDAVQISSRDIPNYTCEQNNVYVMVCDRGLATTFLCACRVRR